MKPTPGTWRLASDAQGPCMIMHPTKKGVALAVMTDTHVPANGFHDDNKQERIANVVLMHAAKDLLEALETALPSMHPNHAKIARAAIAKARGNQ